MSDEAAKQAAMLQNVLTELTERITPMVTSILSRVSAIQADREKYLEYFATIQINLNELRTTTEKLSSEQSQSARRALCGDLPRRQRERSVREGTDCP